MIFSSASFFAFFTVVFALYLAARSTQQRASLLLAASILFYASWKPGYLLLLAISLVTNFVIYNFLLRKRSLSVLVAGIALNLLALGACKYLGLAWESALWIGYLAGWATDNSLPEWLHWALPLGVSFYTFHMLSALIDVYRGHWAKPISFSRWCLYVTFFPHLIAGPILRPGQLIDQLGDLKAPTIPEIRLGAAIFAAGLIKKVLFADNLAPIVDRLYLHPTSLDFSSAWLATLAFAFQIYFDFSGYSEMAIGLARFFGVSLPRNFLYPYISRGPSEFWRRWHVTLSQWLRDYLYIPLGGSRGNSARTSFNLFVTMLLGGLWHGANWTFAIWGVLHGTWLILARIWSGLYAKTRISTESFAGRLVSAISLPITFLLLCFTWVFFRAPNFGDACAISSAMLGLANIEGPAPTIRMYETLIIVVSCLIAFVEPRLVRRLATIGIESWWRLPFALRGMVYFSAAMILIILGGPVQKFIYFDF